MSLSPESLDALVAAGATAEMIAAVVKAEMAAAEKKKAERRASAAERQRRKRERDAKSRDVTDVHAESRDVTRDSANPSLSPPSSPEPPSTTSNLSNCPPIAPQKQGSGGVETSALAERLWALQPVVGGKRKATKADLGRALKAALGRGGDPANIEAAFAAYYALPDCRKDGGQFAKGGAVLLSEDRWRDFIPTATPPQAERRFTGPADLRAALVAAHPDGETFARKYVDTSGWQEVPFRALIVRNPFAADQFKGRPAKVLAHFGVALDMASHGAAA